MNTLELKTLREHIQAWIKIGKLDRQSYWYMLSDFLHKVKYNTTDSNELESILSEEPFNKDDTNIVSKIEMAFTAGVADMLCFEKGLDAPEWTRRKQYFLEEPYFSNNAQGELRIILLHDSPGPFRIRNIYTSRNTLNVV